jgi:diguanylate cyclase (GGDEF)-like protein
MTEKSFAPAIMSGPVAEGAAGLFHCALVEHGEHIKSTLLRTLGPERAVIHRVQDEKQLLTTARRVVLDLLFLSAGNDLSDVLAWIAHARRQAVLTVISTVVYRKEWKKGELLAAYAAGADWVFGGEWDDEVIAAQLSAIMERSRRDLGVNPTSRLPGPGLLDSEINRRLDRGQTFAVCYGDLDNFKAYNDYHGYGYGDKIVRLTAQIIRDVAYDLSDDAFVGHIGGDDFLFIIPQDEIDSVCQNIIATFDRVIPFRYSESDRQQGFIITKNRKGQIEKYPIMSISIAVLINQPNMFTHVGEMSRMLADLKAYTKSKEGSNYFIERRKKY